MQVSEGLATRGRVLEEKFSKTLCELLQPSYLLVPSTQPPAPVLAIAVSGGADSMALALLAHGWATKHGGTIIALTVDHRLRPESTAEAQQVAQWMGERGIEHHILTPHHTDSSNNLQEAARHWRYDVLAEYCHDRGLLHCLIAHHAGDQRETVALHVARGDTADGGSGMALRRNYRGIRFLRPLLGVEKDDLKKYLLVRAACWLEDPSNSNADFARVRVRQQLAADMDQCAELTQQAATEGAARAARDASLAEAAMRLITIDPRGFADMLLDGWCVLEPALATQLLADLLTTIGGATQRPRRNDTMRLAEALRAPAIKKRTLHGCEISCRKNGIRNTIRIVRELARVAPPVILCGTGRLQWDGRFTVHYALPEGVEVHVAALGRGAGMGASGGASGASHLPASTPALHWPQDVPHHEPHAPCVPHAATGQVLLPFAGGVRIAFTPPKTLAAAPFWWLK